MIGKVCYNLEALRLAVKERIVVFEKEIIEYPSEELMKLARETVCETILNPRLMNTYTTETTPIGDVSMRYNASNQAFEYYSDRSIPRRYLETVGRKYVITNNCPHLFIDTESEIKLALLKHTKDDEKKKAREDLQVAEKSKQIFAKFKSYNNPKSGTRSQKNKSMPMKNRSASPNTSSAFQFGPINSENISVVQERSNKYIYIDRLSSFNPEKKAEINVDKKTMTFAEYKASLSQM